MQLPKHSEGWFLLLFSILFFIGLALAIDYVGPVPVIWPDRIMEVVLLMPYVVVVCATTTTMAVEAIFMLAERYLKRKYEEGKKVGVQLLAEKVKDWNERRLEAERRGEEFKEPPPTEV